MTLNRLASRYIEKTERVLNGLKVSQSGKLIDGKSVKDIIDEAKRYFEDAKYYLERKEFETSLASVAYCEGMLDALRLLGLVEFIW